MMLMYVKKCVHRIKLTFEFPGGTKVQLCVNDDFLASQFTLLFHCTIVDIHQYCSFQGHREEYLNDGSFVNQARITLVDMLYQVEYSKFTTHQHQRFVGDDGHFLDFFFDVHHKIP
jgi:hypothetical protein